MREATRLDPDNALAQLDLAADDQDSGDWSGELMAAQAAIKLSPQNIGGPFFLAYAYTKMQRGEDAVKAFDLVQPATELDRQLVDAGRLTYQALLKPDLRSRALAGLDSLRSANISPDAQYYVLPLYLALGEKEAAMQMLPGLCVAEADNCNDLVVNPVYTPLRGDPRFEKLSQKYTTITLGSAPAAASSR